MVAHYQLVADLLHERIGMVPLGANVFLLELPGNISKLLLETFIDYRHILTSVLGKTGS